MYVSTDTHNLKVSEYLRGIFSSAYRIPHTSVHYNTMHLPTSTVVEAHDRVTQCDDNKVTQVGNTTPRGETPRPNPVVTSLPDTSSTLVKKESATDVSVKATDVSMKATDVSVTDTKKYVMQNVVIVLQHDTNEKFRCVLQEKYDVIGLSDIMILMRWCVKVNALDKFKTCVQLKPLPREMFHQPDVNMSTTLSHLLSSPYAVYYLKQLLYNSGLTMHQLQMLNPIHLLNVREGMNGNDFQKLLKFLELPDTGSKSLRANIVYLMTECSMHNHGLFLWLWRNYEDMLSDCKAHTILTTLMDNLKDITYYSPTTETCLIVVVQSKMYNVSIYDACSLDLLSYAAYIGSVDLMQALMNIEGFGPSNVKNNSNLLFQYAMAKPEKDRLLPLLYRFYGIHDIAEEKDVSRLVSILLG